MKFLGWMHRKLRENTIEPLKDLSIGSCTCLAAQQLHEEEDSQVNTEFSSRSGSRHTKLEYYPFDSQEASIEIPDLFHGFLTIGTLGTSDAPAITDPPTPTFPVSLDDITEKFNNEVTADDLKLINEELERFIEAESEEEACNGASRSSYVSAVTLIEAPLFPLQGYLFGSTIELPERRTTGKQNRKVSLGQLFEERKLEDKANVEESENGYMPGKAVGKSTKSLIKKVLKKMGTSSSRGSDDDPFGGDGTNPTVPKKRLQKVLQMFHRKIHPENSGAAKEWKAKTSHGRKKKNATLYHTESSNSKDDVQKFTQRAKIRARSPDMHIISEWSDDSEGHWIKTDEDYLVLEL